MNRGEHFKEQSRNCAFLTWVRCALKPDITPLRYEILHYFIYKLRLMIKVNRN